MYNIKIIQHMQTITSSTMAGTLIIWLTLVYLINFSSTEIELVFLPNACNRTCANLDSSDSCNVEDVESGFQCPGFINRKNECVYQCEADEVICRRANRTYTSCGSTCHSTCANLYTKFMTPCVSTCFVGCGCSDGYVLNVDGECILPENCNQIEVKCPEHTNINVCGRGVLRTCYNYREEIEEHSVCIPTCSCPDNLVFDAETETCVEYKFCHDSEENQDCKKKHGHGSRYRCDDGICGCLCSDWYTLNLDTYLCEFDWDFASYDSRHMFPFYTYSGIHV